MRLELDEMTKKYNSLKRNFDSVSHYAKKDNSDYTRVKNLADSFEKEVVQLREEKLIVENELSEAKMHKLNAEREAKEQKKTIE